MKIILGKQGSGKTTWLIRKSARTGATIVTDSMMKARDLENVARFMGLEIPTPVSYYQIAKNQMNRGYLQSIKAVLLDNADCFLESLFACPIDTVTISSENIEGELYNIGDLE